MDSAGTEDDSGAPPDLGAGAGALLTSPKGVHPSHRALVMVLSGSLLWVIMYRIKEQ